ncbi:MAG TPA: TetR/AcrR family transcriptional regulator [Bacteroidales bacterium]|nr:TetR/AcrR family transcriptional regulator [Bacteroidales bacterium]HRX98077.1 TetR/AcrR family transcriptional regulator [Bacteroidales bacterium]
MAEKDLNTEQKILEAARLVFTQKGFEGARMQEIADEAGINKALLHYYYRSKDKLFEGVFREAFFTMVPQVMDLLKSEMPLFEKIRFFTSNYIEIFINNPFIPGFVLHELSVNPKRIVDLLSNLGIQPALFLDQIQAEIDKGIIKPIDPRNLLTNMLAMCIFPFVARPILQNILFTNDEQAFAQFVEDRKKAVPEFIINAIKNE